MGIENYDWYLKNVHLIPYTWEDMIRVMRRELARSHSSLTAGGTTESGTSRADPDLLPPRSMIVS